MAGVPGTNEVTDSVKNGISDHENDSSGNGIGKEVEYDQKEDLRFLAELICSEDIPPMWFEDYLKISKDFNLRFKPSFSEVESECMKVYEERRRGVKNLLRDYDGQISLSVDLMRYQRFVDCRFIDYLCLSAHFIDKNWTPQKYIIYSCKFCPFSSVLSPSSDPLQKYEDWGIFRSLEDWGIENKILTLAMKNDNCCNTWFEYVRRHIQGKKELQLHGQMFRVYCCGEIISVMVQLAYDKIEDIVHKLQKVYPIKTIFPMWFLKHLDLQNALNSMSEGKLSSKDGIDPHDVPSLEEWKKVEGVCKIVKSILEVSNALFYKEPLTSNVYLYHLHEIRKILAHVVSTGSDSFDRTIAEGMLEKFDKYWDDMFLLLAICTALDPRFKMRYIELICSDVKAKDGNSQVAVVLGVLHKLFDEHVTRFPQGKKSHNLSVLQDYQQLNHLNDQAKEKSELDLYLEGPVLPFSNKFDALCWWRRASAEYPTLSRMAQDFLVIPVSLLVQHEAFYTAPIRADENLGCLNPELMNALMCTRSWAYPRR